MYIISLENCPGCNIFKQRHPELQVIQIPRNSTHMSKDLLPVKKALYRLGVKEFPVILNNSFTAVIPLKEVDPEFAKSMED